MASTQHAPTELEVVSDLVLPTADKLAGRFPLTPNAHPATPEEHSEIISTPTFGKKFADHMTHMRWTHESGRDDHDAVPYGPLELTPGAFIFYYYQSVFEGIEIYKHEDGPIWALRPGYNIAYLNHSARRLALSEVGHEDFVTFFADYVRAGVRWVPEIGGSSFHLYPSMFASEEFVGIYPTGVVDYYVTGPPSDPYLKGGLSDMAIQIERECHRAGPGGTGSARTNGNYAASLLPQIQAEAKGFSQVCFLDTYEGRYLEELGGMSMFVVMTDGAIRIPELIGVILEGGTRNAILRMPRDEGVAVHKKKIALSEIVDGIRPGTITEIFTYDTAVVVTPVMCPAGDDLDVGIEAGDKTREIHKRVTDIQ